ncbi:DinB family protein [Maribacter sp. 4G9]|uniref:DinB family protein n=1 Tax=Maribacter sp. 4G9 TaxID=1889777 RepID=UPI000C155FB3|nr:DUF1572 family protein [Maribacter sp. 4G9]PIB38127.1 hypothetical protein BFP75_18135 [Maribacter sp. 4G9]
MDKESQLIEELVKNALYRMDESTRMIKKSLGIVTDKEIWQKPNDSLNSIGNLILHLCGNMTQYIISSLGEVDDVRDRDAEFQTKGGLTKEELIKKLENTVDDAKRVIFDAKPEQLIKIRSVQGFSFSGVGVIMHAVEHFSYHTGQIAFWVKFMRDKDLGFYDGIDLNSINEN